MTASSITTLLATRPSFSWASLPDGLQAVTVVLGVIFIGFGILVYRAWKGRTRASDLSSEAKAMAMTAVGGFITVSVAGASILLAGTGVLIALEPGGSSVPADVFTDLGLTTIWLVLSLICGAVAAAYVINHVHQLHSVAEHPLVMAFSAAQFVALVLGAVYLVIAIFLF